VTYTYGKYMLIIDMELFIIFAQGIIPRVVIWSLMQQHSLRSRVLITAGLPQTAASTVEEVPGKRRHEAELVQMPSPLLRVGYQTITIQRKDGKMETTGRDKVNKSSLTDLEDWDLVDSSNDLSKLQHKL